MARRPSDPSKPAPSLPAREDSGKKASPTGTKPTKRTAKTPTKEAALTTTPSTPSTPATQPTTPVAAGAAPAARPMSRSAFIRSHSIEVPAKQVVKMAEAAGLSLTIGLVYQVRRVARDRAARAARLAAIAATTAARSPGVFVGARPAFFAALNNRMTAEDVLRAAAAEIGLRRAIDLLEEQRRRVLSVLGG
jgi:hypothetical protein